MPDWSQLPLRLQDFCLQSGYKHPDGSNDYRLATSPGDSSRVDAYMDIWVKEVKATMPPMKTAPHDFTKTITCFAALGSQQGWFRGKEIHSLDSVGEARTAILAFNADNTQE